MLPNLHLLVELGCWAPWEGAVEPFLRLETFLGAHGNITVTLLSWGPLRPGLERLAKIGDWSFPDHFITEGGLALFHARASGAWVEDLGYHRWVGARWDPLALERAVFSQPSYSFRQILGAGSARRAIFKVEPDHDPARAVAELEACLAQTSCSGRLALAGEVLEVVPLDVGPRTAAAYLHQHLATPCALMACGGSEAFQEVLGLADFPVPLAGGPEGILAALSELQIHPSGLQWVKV